MANTTANITINQRQALAFAIEAIATAVEYEGIAPEVGTPADATAKLQAMIDTLDRKSATRKAKTSSGEPTARELENKSLAEQAAEIMPVDGVTTAWFDANFGIKPSKVGAVCKVATKYGIFYSAKVKGVTTYFPGVPTE